MLANLPNMTKYLQQHLEIPSVPMAAWAMDTIDHLPVTSRGHHRALKATGMHTSYVFAITMKEKSAENVEQAYLSGLFTQKGGSIATFSDNGTEWKKHHTQGGM